MGRPRLLRSLCLSGALLAVAVSCSNPKDDEDFIPSQPGAVQPDEGGPLLAEGAACTRLQSAEAAARKALSCSASKATCPELIRPAGLGDDCYQYSQASIDECADQLDAYQSCDDFELHPCLVAAVVKTCAGSVPDPEPGEGGAGGTPGLPGDAGAGGVAGEAGTGGTAP